MKRLLLAADQVTVLSVQVGEGAGALKVDCLYWKWLVKSGMNLD